MRRNGLCIVFFVIVVWFMCNACMAGTNPTENCEIAKENTSQKKGLLPLDDIVSSVLEIPGGIINGISNIPLDDIASSTLKIPGDAVKFVAEIPYDEIVWTTLKVSAKVIELVVDDGFLIGFLVGYHCYH